jgi:hypothetical protein
MIQQITLSTECIGNTDGITIYYEQETGTDQINAGGVTTAVIGTITSGDFDITQRRSNTGQTVGMPDLRGDGEFIMRIKDLYQILFHKQEIHKLVL